MKISIDSKLQMHPVTLHVSEALTITQSQAIGHILLLIFWAAEHDIINLWDHSTDVVSRAANYSGDGQIFCKAIEDSGLTVDGKIQGLGIFEVKK